MIPFDDLPSNPLIWVTDRWVRRIAFEAMQAGLIPFVQPTELCLVHEPGCISEELFPMGQFCDCRLDIVAVYRPKFIEVRAG